MSPVREDGAAPGAVLLDGEALEPSQVPEALRRSEARMAALLENAPDAILAVDEHRHITTWNRSAEAMFGYSAAEAIGMDLARLLPDRHRASHREHVSRFVTESVAQRPMDHDAATGLRKSGEEFAVSVTISSFRIDGEQVLMASVREVTEHRRIETERRILGEVCGALACLDPERAIGALVHALSQSLTDAAALYAVDDAGDLQRIELASRAADADAASLVTDLPPVPQASHPVRRAVGAGHGIIDGQVLAMPLVWGDRTLGVLGLAAGTRRFDVRDLRFVEEIGRRVSSFLENQRLHEAERRATRRRDEILGVVAHDLRNPLNGIVLQAALLRRTTAPPVRAAEGIERSVGRMKSIIDDLLDMSQIDAGMLRIVPARTSVRTLLADVVASHNGPAEALSLTLQVAPVEDLYVWADRARVLQILENLIGNAVKFTRTGGVSVRADGTGAEVLFRVSDTGPGIPAEHLADVFDRYWQSRTDRTGAGLGMSIVKGLVEAHGGHVWVDSPPGGGTTVSFTLPLSALDAREDVRPGRGQPATVTPYSSTSTPSSTSRS